MKRTYTVIGEGDMSVGIPCAETTITIEINKSTHEVDLINPLVDEWFRDYLKECFSAEHNCLVYSEEELDAHTRQIEIENEYT